MRLNAKGTVGSFGGRKLVYKLFDNNTSRYWIRISLPVPNQNYFFKLLNGHCSLFSVSQLK